jgi:undecaprenyl-diphosphatase
LLEKIIEIDKTLFFWLNKHHNWFFDELMSWVSFPKTWIPFYLILLFLIFKNFQFKNSLFIIITLVVSVGLSDFIASGILKPFFERLRPCHDPFFSGKINNIVGCGGKFGFVSSHASTSFALAVGLTRIYSNKIYFKYILFFWAFIVAYSRVYLGVHYPLDIFFGALLGGLISTLMFYGYYKITRN